MKSIKNLPSTQKLFMVFSITFVILVFIIVITGSNSFGDPNSSSIPSILASQLTGQTSGEDIDSSGVISTEDVSEEPSDVSSEESLEESLEESSEEPSEEPSEVSSEVSKETFVEDPNAPPWWEGMTFASDLPYDPKTYADLKRNDIQPSELDNYFKDSVFIGNSLVTHFYNFYSVKRATDKNFLGGAKFLQAAAFSARVDLSDPEKYKKYYPTITVDGVKKLVHTWEGVAHYKSKTVYYNIMALNEIGIYAKDNVEKTFQNTVAVLEKMKQAVPDVNIVVLSNTYMVGVNGFNSAINGLNNKNISQLNNKMLEWCNEKGYDFIDVSSPYLVGDVLSVKYCMDSKARPKGCGCHMYVDCYAGWTAILRNYAYQKQNGTWKNPESMRILSTNE